jgi:serine/threonine protein kinase/Tol biopolymer transport system component
MPLAAGTRLGLYEILAPIGAGGMGEVYRAKDTRLGRDVAIKVLPDAFAHDAERMTRFEREAQVLASLNHPHIATIHGLEESNGVRALVMELVEGPTLAERIGGHPMEDALSIAKQIAEGMEYAHERGIIHRDLKPANVKLTADGNVKILDFGLAKALDVPTPPGNSSISPTLTLEGTRAGVILGTAAYMAPEQARGAIVDKRADIWAFGVVLYEMLTGKQPFAGPTISDTLAAVLKSEPDLSQVPPQARRLVRGCLEKDPKRRLRDIGDFRILCQEPQAEAAPIPRRALAWMGVSGLLVLVLAALALVHFREAPPAERAVRLSVPIPENSRVSYFALSPDGRHLVISLLSAGKSKLWLRALDSTQLQPLSGTDNARGTFWSADGRSIGFFADRKLKTIPASGGPTQVLCDTGLIGGGTWNSDGVILFSSGGPLQRVEATGGACTPVTKTETGRILYPVFLPDDKHFLYYLGGRDDAKKGVYLGTLDNPIGRRVLTDRSGVVFVPPASGIGHGHILFLRETTLMAQPFDARTLQLAGDAFPVAGQASMNSSGVQVAASASRNGVLVYLANSIRDSQLTWFDRSGKEQGKIGSHGDLSAVSLSPDEKIVAFGRPPGGVWLHELTRDVDTQFTFPPLVSYGAVWSPDGGRIAFGASSGDLYRKDASGGGQEELLLPKGNLKFPSDWSYDGRYLLYTEDDPKTRYDLWILPDPLGKSGGGTPVPFLRTEFSESQGQFSPDGRWVAYVSDQSGQFEVYVRPFPSGAGQVKVSRNGGREPRWRRDGKELFYLEPDGLMHRLMTVPIQAASRPLFAAGASKPLFVFRVPTFLTMYNSFPYSVAAGGQRFLVGTAVSTAEPTLNVILNWEKAAAVK